MAALARHISEEFPEALAGGAAAEREAELPALAEQAHPLSFAQQRLWLLDLIEPGSAKYNVPVAVRLEGGLETGLLIRALAEIVRRHEPLRTVYARMDGEPVQAVLPPPAASGLAFARVDLSGLPAPARDRALRQGLNAEAARPFDLARGPVVRFLLLDLGADLGTERRALMATFHHIATDGWSMAIFFRELAVLYADFAAGRPPSLPELPVRYADWAVWQRQALAGGALDAQLAYWRRQLAGLPVLALPADRPRSAATGDRGASRVVPLPADLAGRLRGLGSGEGITVFIALLSGFAAALGAPERPGRSRGGPHLRRAQPAAHRGADRLLRQHPGGARPAGGRPAVRGAAAAGARYRAGRPEASGRPLRAAGRGAPAGAGRRPHPALPDRLHLSGQPALAGADAGSRRRAAGRRGGGGEVRPDAVGLRERRAPERLGGVPHRALRSRHRRALDGAPAGAAGDGGGRPRPPAIGAAAALGGRALAGGGGVERHRPAAPRGALPARAGRGPGGAHARRSGGGRRGRGADSIASSIARANRPGPPPVAAGVGAGGGGGPLRRALAGRWSSACWPSSRPAAPTCRSIPGTPPSAWPACSPTPARRCCWRRRPAGRDAAAGTARAVLFLDRWTTAAIAHGARPMPPLPGRATAANLACVIYTSGSTGRPKGVVLPHRGLVNRLLSAQETYRLTAADADRSSSSAASFDVAIWECFAPLIAGGAAGRRRARTATRDRGPGTRAHRRAAGLTVVHLRTVDAGPGPARSGGGRRVPARCARSSPAARRCRRRCASASSRRRLAGSAACTTSYGPTEIVDRRHPPGWMRGGKRARGRSRSAGRLPGRSAHLLDRAARQAPVGVPGELCLGGVAGARLLWTDPALTAERFVPDPFGVFGVVGERLYRHRRPRPAPLPAATWSSCGAPTSSSRCGASASSRGRSSRPSSRIRRSRGGGGRPGAEGARAATGRLLGAGPGRAAAAAELSDFLRARGCRGT